MTRPENSSFATRAALRASVALLAVAFLTGCPWKKEIEKLKTDNTVLTQDKQKLEGQLASAGVETAEMQSTLDDVQKSLEELRTKELQVIRSSIAIAKEGKGKTQQREQLKAEIDTIKQSIKENLDKLAKLEKEKKAAEQRAAASGKKVKELEGQVTTLGRLVDEMRKQLEEKAATIAELEVKVLELSQTVEQQAGVIQEKEGVIESQTTEINKAFVAIDHKTVLKNKGLVEKKGSVIGMGGSWMRTGKFDPEVFREIDIRQATEFSVGAPVKKVKVLSDHPKESYELVDAGADGSKLKVTDAALFWKGSKYLVVMIPD